MGLTPWLRFLFPHERAALAQFQREHARRQRERLSDRWVYLTWMACLCLSVAACDGPFIPPGTEQITPPPEYREWWEASRACVAMHEWRPFESVRWYVSPDMPVSSQGVRAAALTVDDRVYLYAPYQDTPWVIQHELVHAINGLGGHPHPDDPFVKCHLMAWQHRNGR